MDDFKKYLRIAAVRILLYFRIKFSRTILGQFWNTLSNAILILVISLVWSKVWSVELSNFMPYYTLSYIVFLFSIGVFIDSTQMILADVTLYRFSRFSFWLSSLTVVGRSIILFLWNLPIFIIVKIFYLPDTNFLFLFFIPIILFFSGIFLLPISMIIGLISFRYRDLCQLFLSIFNVSLLFSPVLWRLDQVPDQFEKFVLLSPISVLIKCFSDILIFGRFDLSLIYIISIEFIAFVSVALYLNFILDKRLRCSL